MQAFKKKDPYIKSTRFEIIKPTFNDASQLVFHIPEDKRCLRMDEAYLSFNVEIPNCYIPGSCFHSTKDNNFASKLFSSLDLTVNHETLSSRGGPVDYSECSDLLIRLLNQSQDNLKTQGTLDGTWDYNSFDSDEITLEICKDRFRSAEQINSPPNSLLGTTTTDYVSANLKQYRFHFYTSLKTPLAYQETPMPSGCSYIFRFVRAPPSLALMLLDWNTFNKVDSRFVEGQYDLIPSVTEAYTSLPIPTFNPELHVAFSNDSDLVRRTQTISEYGLKIPFLDFSMRRNILVKGMSEYEVRLGDLERSPELLIFALSDPEREKGRIDQSPCKFSRYDLESFDLRRSGLSLSGYPINYSESDGLMFYVRFLDSVNLHGNPYASGMSQTDFLDRNFCVVEDLTKYEDHNGSLTVRLKFKTILAENLLLLCLPLTKRELCFTDNLAVHIQ